MFGNSFHLLGTTEESLAADFGPFCDGITSLSLAGGNMDEGVQVGRSFFSCCFVSECQGFEFDTGGYWEPEQVFEQWGDMCCFRLLGEG